MTDAEADSYFATRAASHGWVPGRLISRASCRSERRWAAACGVRGEYSGDDIPRPPNWSGFRVSRRASSSGRHPFQLYRTVDKTPRPAGRSASCIPDAGVTAPPEQTEAAALLRRLAAAAPVETHISLVFVCADTVWKLEKAVRLAFLDFSTMEARRRFTLRELELNKPAAPEG